MQGEKESLRSNIDRFTQIAVEVEGPKKAIQCWTFKNGLLCDHHFCTKLGKKKVKNDSGDAKLGPTIHDIGRKPNTRFDNPTSHVDVSFNLPTGKESRWKKEDIDRGHTAGTINIHF